MKALVNVFVDQGCEYDFHVDDKAGILQHRRTFVHNLGVLLAQTGADVESCSLLPGDMVRIVYRNGAIKTVDIALDSCLAIVRDVCRKV